MKEYVQLISVYEKKLLNLTVRVEVMEKDSIGYTQLDFELIKLEVKEMHKLVIQLKENFVGSSEIIDKLEIEVRNDSLLSISVSFVQRLNECYDEGCSLSSPLILLLSQDREAHLRSVLDKCLYLCNKLSVLGTC